MPTRSLFMYLKMNILEECPYPGYRKVAVLVVMTVETIELMISIVGCVPLSFSAAI